MVATGPGHSHEEFAIRRGKKRLETGIWHLGRDSFFELGGQTF